MRVRNRIRVYIGGDPATFQYPLQNPSDEAKKDREQPLQPHTKHYTIQLGRIPDELAESASWRM